jgi:tetratricopeptide (TPR) repeat protein
MARADAALTTAQLLLAIIAIGAGAFALRQHYALRDLKRDADATIMRVDKLREEAEARFSTALAAEDKVQTMISNGENALRAIETRAEDRLREMEHAQENVQAFLTSVTKSPMLELDPDLTALLGQLAVSMGKFDMGAQLMERAVNAMPEDERDPNRLSQLAGILDHIGKYEDAIRYADAALAKDPNHIAAHVNRGLAQLHSADDRSKTEEEGRRLLESALGSFEAARQLHFGPDGLQPPAYEAGKLFFFAAEAADKLGILDEEHRHELCLRAAAWYTDVSMWMARRADQTEQEWRRDCQYWVGHAQLRLRHLLHQFPTLPRELADRPDIPRGNNGMPLWPMEERRV